MKWIWIGIYVSVLVWSAINPKDQTVWLLEVGPALIGAVILLFTRRSFPLTPLVYGLILLHCIILMVGGHYTYAEVPLFDCIRDLVGGTHGFLRASRHRARVKEQAIGGINRTGDARWCLGCYSVLSARRNQTATFPPVASVTVTDVTCARSQRNCCLELGRPLRKGLMRFVIPSIPTGPPGRRGGRLPSNATVPSRVEDTYEDAGY